MVTMSVTFFYGDRSFRIVAIAAHPRAWQARCAMNEAVTAAASFALLGGGSLLARRLVERSRPLRLTEHAKRLGETEDSVAPQIAVHIVSFLYAIAFSGSLARVLASHYREGWDWSEAHPVTAPVDTRRWLFWLTAEQSAGSAASTDGGVREAATFYGLSLIHI